MIFGRAIEAPAPSAIASAAPAAVVSPAKMSNAK
jgi:hypothetical protein